MRFCAQQTYTTVMMVLRNMRVVVVSSQCMQGQIQDLRKEPMEISHEPIKKDCTPKQLIMLREKRGLCPPLSLSLWMQKMLPRFEIRAVSSEVAIV
jgi:hypothetical protein